MQLATATPNGDFRFSFVHLHKSDYWQRFCTNGTVKAFRGNVRSGIMNRDILGSLGTSCPCGSTAFTPPQNAMSHCVSSGWCGMSLEVGWTDSPWGSLSPTIQTLNSCSFDFVGKNTRCIRTAHASGPSTGWIRWSQVTSLTAPMYTYAHCLFHLLSGSRAARLLSN